MTSVQTLLANTAQVIPEGGLEAKLQKAQAEQRPLRVKLGADPTAPDLHLGHTVILRKLRQFQEAGHRILFLIGDFTGLLGDPSGRSETRKPLSVEQVQANAQTYENQIYRILDPEATELCFNSTWSNPLQMKDVLHLTQMVTVSQILERDDFAKRFAKHAPIALSELIYPILQGYDSVMLKADIEFGGTDQTFNLLMGRQLQSHFGQDPQLVMTMPLIEGLDGVQKMSKSLGNAVGITDAPEDMFGKLMSIPDTLIGKYMRLLTDMEPNQITQAVQAMQQGANPRTYKAQMAARLVEMYHGAEASHQAQKHFDTVFRLGGAPENMPAVRVDEATRLSDLILAQGFAKSRNEVYRLIRERAVRLDTEVLSSDLLLYLPEGGESVRHTLQIGKRRFCALEAAQGLAWQRLFGHFLDAADPRRPKARDCERQLLDALQQNAPLRPWIEEMKAIEDNP